MITAESKKIKKRILYISHSATVAGAEMSLLHLLKNLNREKYQPLVIFPEDGILKKYVDELGIQTVVSPLIWWIPGESWNGRHHYNSMLKGLNNRVNSIRQIIKMGGIDLVQTNTITIIEGALAARAEGIPHIWHVCENLLESELLKPYIPVETVFSLVNELSDQIVVISEYQEKRLKTFINNDKIRLIYEGIPVDEYKKISADKENPLRKKLGIADNEILIAALGSLTTRKNPDAFIAMAAEILKKRKNLSFVWLGKPTDNELFRKIQAKISALNLEKYVFFPGFCKNVPKALYEIDIFVHTSFNENLSLVCIEAMAVGKPVISTRCGGPEEVVSDGESGYLVSIDNKDELTEKILKLLDNPDLRMKMGRKGRIRAENLFDVKKNIKNFETMYDDIPLLNNDNKILRKSDYTTIQHIIDIHSRMSELGFPRKYGSAREFYQKLKQYIIKKE